MGEYKDDAIAAILSHLNSLRESVGDLHRKADILMTAAETTQAAVDAITAELADVKTKVAAYEQSMLDEITALEAQIASGAAPDLTALKAAADGLGSLESAPAASTPPAPTGPPA